MRTPPLLLALALLALVACEQTDKPRPASPETRPAQPEATPVELAPSPVPVSAPALVKPPAAPPRPAQAAQAVTAPNKMPAPVAKPAPPAQVAPPSLTAPLDLSLPDDLLLAPLQAEEVPLAPLLPPLFGARVKPESPFQLHGKLISNERVDDYWESLEGAELQFEFKQ